MTAGLADRFRGALVGAGVGDCLGAPFEGTHTLVDDDHLAMALDRPGPWPYTDDTALTIALAESLVHTRRLDPDDVAQRFAATWTAEPNRGYARDTASLLERLAAGGDWRTEAPLRFSGTGSYGNGAAMRVAPVGLATADRPHVMEWARTSALVTHSHPQAVAGAQTIACAVSTMVREPGLGHLELLVGLHDDCTDDMVARAIDAVARLPHDVDPTEVVERVGRGVTAVEAVPAALAAFARHPDSFTDAVRFAISLGGDTDTIAAMTGAVSGARLGMEAIPLEWRRRAEGVDRLRNLAEILYERDPH